MVKLDDFDVLKVIGEWSFGQVMQVRKKDDKRIYAMKKLNLVGYDGDPFAEAQVLRQCSCPFIVKLHYTFKEAASSTCAWSL